MSQKSLYSLRYMPQLDSLRALAALGVLAQHFLPSGNFFRSAVPLGDLSVRLFFVLSGFLITLVILDGRSHIEIGNINSPTLIRRFYVRRLLRLIPVYYIFLTLSFLVLPEPRQFAGWFYLYLQNIHYAIEAKFTLADPLWTLAVEEQFYLVWPFLILFLPRHWLWPAIIFVVTTGIIARFAFLSVGFTHFQASMLTPSHFDSLGTGALLAIAGYKFVQQPDVVKRYLFGAFCLGLLILTGVFFAKIKGMSSSIEFIFGEIGASLLFVWVIGNAAKKFHGPIGFILNQPVLIYLGKISYGIYVYHWFVPKMVKYLLKYTSLSLPPSELWHFFIFSTISIIIAIVSWHFMEKPILSLKRFFSYN